MLLISANLVQLFDHTGFPRGWIRWAWVTETGMVVACAMLVMPEPEMKLLTALNADTDLFALHTADNKRVLLAQFLRSKQDYHQARVHLLRASACDLQILAPPEADMLRLQKNVLENPQAPASTALESHIVLWFWDRKYKAFAVPADSDDWLEMPLDPPNKEETCWEDSLREWKSLTSVGQEAEPTKVLFTCFHGHHITYGCFYAHVCRVNELLSAVVNDQITLITSHWLPTLMCPVDTCLQQLTPSFITRKAIMQQMIPPPVLETAQLLSLLKKKWKIY